MRRQTLQGPDRERTCLITRPATAPGGTEWAERKRMDLLNEEAGDVAKDREGQIKKESSEAMGMGRDTEMPRI